MTRLRIIFLLLSSFWLFNTSCTFNRLTKTKTISTTVVTNENLIPVISENGTSARYKGTIDVLNKHFTGIIVLKQTDPQTKHMVFVTELGMRMFDFVIKADSLKAQYVFDALNKPALVNVLTQNFRDILLISAQNKNCENKQDNTAAFTWIKDHKNFIAIWKNERNFATEIRVFEGNKKHSIIRYENSYASIKLKQYGLVKIRIELNKINE